MQKHGTTVALRYVKWSGMQMLLPRMTRHLPSTHRYAEAWLNRGVALDYLGRYEESVASYDKALELQPNFTTAQENREIALSKKDRINPMTIGGDCFSRDNRRRCGALAM